MLQRIYEKKERETLINEVRDAVLEQLSVMVETEAISQLRDAIQKLGR